MTAAASDSCGGDGQRMMQSTERRCQRPAVTAGVADGRRRQMSTEVAVSSAVAAAAAGGGGGRRSRKLTATATASGVGSSIGLWWRKIVIDSKNYLTLALGCMKVQ